MLPLHSKHSSGRLGHGHSAIHFGSGVPLFICMSLVVYLVYQRYYYQNLLQEDGDKLFLCAKQTSEAQKNLMAAEQKIVSLKDAHEEDSLTISALTNNVKKAEEEQRKLSSKLTRLGSQYTQIDNRFQNLSVMMTEMKASYFSEMERYKADIKNARERLMSADRVSTEYRSNLETCREEKLTLSKLLEKIRNDAQNQAPTNDNSAANFNKPQPPLNYNSQNAENPYQYNPSKISHIGNVVQSSPNNGVFLQSNGHLPLSNGNDLKKPELLSAKLDDAQLGSVDDEQNKISGLSLIEGKLDGRNSLNASNDFSQKPKGFDEVSEEKEIDNEIKSEESSGGEEDPVKEHEDIVEKVNTYLKKNPIQST